MNAHLSSLAAFLVLLPLAPTPARPVGSLAASNRSGTARQDPPFEGTELGQDPVSEAPEPGDPTGEDPLPQEPLPQEPLPDEPLPDEPLPDEPLPDEPEPDEPEPGTEEPVGPEEDPFDALRAVHDVTIAEYFAICDHDGDGFVTLTEAWTSLELDRDAFARFDSALGAEGRDGRISPEEFAARYLDTVSRLGTFRPPVPPSAGLVPPVRTPEQLRIAYDSNSDGALDVDEVARALTDYRVEGVAPQAAMAVLDADRDGRLVPSELELMAVMIEDAVRTLPWVPAEESAESIVELFGEMRQRPRTPGAATGPALITGPLPHFQRLDADRDGGIGIDDLLYLQSPSRLSIRPETLLADLDRDHDGELSLEEFQQALGEPAD